jgi:hypothetical protein
LPREKDRRKIGPGYYSVSQNDKQSFNALSVEDRILLQRQKIKEAKKVRFSHPSKKS